MSKPSVRKEGLKHARESQDRAMSAHGSEDDALPTILAKLRERFIEIEALCNPEGENLHFGVRVRTSPAVLERLYEIGLEAWHAVEEAQSRHALHWFYDWFLLVANVTLRIWSDKAQEQYSAALACRLAILLVEISQMTMKSEYEGDIQKRLSESFVHVLLAFGKTRGLLENVRARAQETGKQRVIGFVSGGIEAAESIERAARKSAPGDER